MRTDQIDYAISALERAARRLQSQARTSDDWSEIRDMEATARSARKELADLRRDLPRMADLKRAADRDYDAYVTRPR